MTETGITTALPEEFKKRSRARFDSEEEYRRFIVALESGGAVRSLRINTLKAEEEAVDYLLSHMQLEPLSYGGGYIFKSDGIGATPLHHAGAFYVQDPGAMCAAEAVRDIVTPDFKVLDMCAAPGGKTTHLAQKMENRGEIYASDLYDHKVALIYENAARLGIDIIHAEQKDGVMWGRECPDRFDAVLLDAPCSGLGVLNRRSDSRLRKEPEDILSLAAIQKELLISAHKALKPGGRMVYSTCTLSLEENQKQVQWFLSEFPDMKRQAFDDRIPGLNESEKAQAALGTLELLPYAHQTDGFFISCFKKDTE